MVNDPKILIPMIRQLMPAVIAQDIVGVQPMTGNVGAIMSMSNRPTTPWDYLRNWSMSDRGPEENLKMLNERMQNRWPGNYIVEEFYNPKLVRFDFRLKFNSPKDETWFRLQWP